MAGIQDALGTVPQQTPAEEKATSALQAGMGLPNKNDNGEGNPLEKMDEISKTNLTKKENKDTSLDSDALNEMLMAGDNSYGMFVPNEEKVKPGEPELHEKEDDSMKKKLEGKVEPKGKYIRHFKEDMLKNPDQYKLMTPKGEMTVAEAVRKGYNPLTKKFEQQHDQDAIKEKHLSQLNDADRASLEKLTDPKNAQVAPADAQKYGLKPDSPMVRQQMPEQQAPAQAPTQPMPQTPAAMPQMPAQSAQPAQPEQQQNPLAALLGGKA